MEKIFKYDWNNTQTEKSKIAENTRRDPTMNFLYQARDVGYEYNQKGYYHKRENGVCYLLLYTKSGKATLEYENNVYTLSAGSFIFISLANLNVISAPDSDWEIYFMHAMGSDVDNIYRTFKHNCGCFIENFNEKLFVESVMKIYDEYMLAEIDHYKIAQLIYSLLLDTLKQSNPSPKNVVIEKAIEYLSSNFNKRITIEDLCKKLFVSKYFFIRKFHSAIGCSPKQYLTNLRLEKAKYMLIHTNKSVAEIAQEVGFENEKNIYYAFKTNLGISPTEYKENFL